MSFHRKNDVWGPGWEQWICPDQHITKLSPTDLGGAQKVDPPQVITIAQVRAGVAEIAACLDDPGMATSIEYALRTAVLREIAFGPSRVAADLAREVLKTGELEFSRDLS